MNRPPIPSRPRSASRLALLPVCLLFGACTAPSPPPSGPPAALLRAAHPAAAPTATAPGDPGLATCPAADFPALQGTLPAVAAALKERRPIRIVALGSSSTQGTGASEPARAYPQQLEARLKSQWPRATVSVTNAGIGGEELPQMLARIDRDVLAAQPTLVIWQFGSNGVLRLDSLDGFEAAARRGVERIRASGADVILMDLQHVPRIEARPLLGSMQALMRRVAVATGSALYRRHALMTAWNAQLGNAYQQMYDPDRLHMNDRSYDCMADNLARDIALASRGQARPLPVANSD